MRGSRRRPSTGREVRTALADLVASPHDLSTALVMPVGAMLAVSHSVGLTLGNTTVVQSNGATFSTPTLVADEIHKGVWAEKGQSVTVTGAPTGVLSLHYVDSLNGVLSPVIGTLTVA